MFEDKSVVKFENGRIDFNIDHDFRMSMSAKEWLFVNLLAVEQILAETTAENFEQQKPRLEKNLAAALSWNWVIGSTEKNAEPMRGGIDETCYKVFNQLDQRPHPPGFGAMYADISERLKPFVEKFKKLAHCEEQDSLASQ